MNRLENHILQKPELVRVYKYAEEGGEGFPWVLIGGIIVVVIAISAFALYKRK